jgi:hypothetical protein
MRPADGVTLLERAITLQPAEPGAYRELGMIHLATGNTAGALRLFEKVLQLQPRSPDVQANFAGCGQPGLLDPAPDRRTALVRPTEPSGPLARSMIRPLDSVRACRGRCNLLWRDRLRTSSPPRRRR